MAETVNSDLIIYNEQVQTAYLERVQDVLEVFNAASNGAIVMRNELLEGNLTQEAFYTVPGGVEHRDVNSTGTVTPTAIGADEMVGVKSPWKYGPYSTTEEAFKRRARSVGEFSQVIGQHMADSALVYMIQAAMAAATAAIGGNASMTTTASWAADHKKVLTKGMRLLGDRFNRIAIFVMDSGTYFDMVDDAIAEKLFEEAGLVVYGGLPGTMGKPVLVTDTAPADTILGLQPGAVEIIESQAPGFRTYNIDDKENLAIGFRAEGTFNTELMGYSWNTTGSPVAAPINPNIGQLGSSANWRKHAQSDKATAGIMIEVTAGSPSP